MLLVTIAQLNLSESLNATPMLDTFTNLAGLCFWWPETIFDGRQSVKCVVGNDSRTYHARLQLLTKNVYNEVNQFCNDTDAKLARRLEKTNIHRLFEVVNHRLPVFHHEFFCQKWFSTHFTRLPNLRLHGTRQGMHISPLCI